MKGTYQNQYLKKAKTGETVCIFVYTVSGTPAELEAYKDAQGANYRTTKDTNIPLYYTLNYTQDDIELIITEKGKVIVDNRAMMKASSLAKQYSFMADKLADRIVSEIMPSRNNSATAGINQTEAQHQSIDPFTI